MLDNTDYRRLVEGSPDAIFIARHGCVAYLNDAAQRLLGASSRDQILGKPVDRFFSLDDGKITRVDGTVRDADLLVAPLHGDGAAIQLVARDITERKRADAALRDSEERLSLAFTGAREGVWDWNLETGDVVYSSRWKQMLGYADDEIEPHVSAWERLVHPDDRERADRANASVASGATTYEAEFRLRHKDGHYVHVLSRGFPVRREPDGAVIRIVGTHLDLADRMRAEAALRESEERLRLAFAGAQEGVWDWNLETGDVVYSPRWKEMLGYSDDEVEPHVSAWQRLLHPDDTPRAVALHDSLAKGAQTYEGEFRLRHKEGHYVHVLSRGYPIRREPGGAVVRIVGTHFDLTSRNERARADLLGRLVFAQEDERRRIAREMHDQFGELLTGLARRIEMLRDVCAGSKEQTAQVEALAALAHQLDRDVDHLVWELRPTALDDLGLRAALANYVQDWSSRVNIRADLHTSGLLDERLPRDVETTLYRIAQEALTNIAKHSRAEHVEVILERRSDHVLLVVEDDGVGFDSAAAGSANQGFGLLGMQERAALVGATLEIESGVGRGTTILVRTPDAHASTDTLPALRGDRDTADHA